jgi:hypothetical protein
MRLLFRTAAKMMFLLSLLTLTQACAITSQPTSALEVNAAFETSGLVPMKPYTRTIFSTSNF